MGVAVESEFDGSNFGDSRLNERIKKIATAISRKPEQSLSASIGNFHESKAAYRFFANPKVTPNKMIEPHVANTLTRMYKEKGDILILHDTTDLIYTPFTKTKDLGTIHTGKGYTEGVKGIFLHHSLATTETGVPLGLLKQTYFTYEDYLKLRGQPIRNQKGINKNYPIEEKASFRWLEHVKETDNLASGIGLDAIHVGDRESDIYELLQYFDTHTSKFVIRSCINRRTEGPKGTMRDTKTINEVLNSIKSCGQVKIELPNYNGQKKNHSMNIKYSTVRLVKPQRKLASKILPALQSIDITVIEVQSQQEPSLHWRILTNMSVNNLTQAIRVIDIYKKRWLIECYHRILKSGYKIEHARLKDRSRLEKFSTLVSIVSWRIMWLYLYSRESVDYPCKKIFAPEELKVLSIMCKKHGTSINRLSIKEAVVIIAKLGGFLGRKSDGDPGMMMIWKGWKVLYDRIIFLQEVTYG